VQGIASEKSLAWSRRPGDAVRRSGFIISSLLGGSLGLAGCLAENPPAPAKHPASRVVLPAGMPGQAGPESETPGISPENQTAIYDPQADAELQVQQALARAKVRRTHVLLVWGGNWCSWCQRLHQLFEADAAIAARLAEEFEVLWVDVQQNLGMLNFYDEFTGERTFPWLTVLDAQGNVLVNQETESLERGAAHEPGQVARFLDRWSPPGSQAAGDKIDQAVHEAARRQAAVLMLVGIPYSEESFQLRRFLAANRDMLQTRLVLIDLDLHRTPQAREILEKRLPEAPWRSLPWLIALDSQGKVLATSWDAGANFGYPVSKEEVERCCSVLRRAGNFNAEQLEVLAENLRFQAGVQRTPTLQQQFQEQNRIDSQQN